MPILSGCITLVNTGAGEIRNESFSDEYGLQKITRRDHHTYDGFAHTDFVRADIARMIMSGHFIGEEEVSGTFRRTMPQSVSILPYTGQTLQAYADKENCLLAMTTDYANAWKTSGTKRASIKKLSRISRFGRYLRGSLRYMPNKDASFLNSHPKLDWQLICFEPLGRIVPVGKKVLSAVEIVQIMLLDVNILRGRNVVSSDRYRKNHVVVSRDTNGRITILLRNFTMSNDVLALGIEHDVIKHRH